LIIIKKQCRFKKNDTGFLFYINYSTISVT
jgi:hypothetical protein